MYMQAELAVVVQPMQDLQYLLQEVLTAVVRDMDIKVAVADQILELDKIRYMLVLL